MPASQRIAIVGMGGIFPSPGAARTTPARRWELVLGAVDASRDVPEGRWALSPDECFAPEVGAVDKVYSRRGYFIDSCRCDPAGLDISADVLARLDPLFHLTLAAGVEAFAPAATGRLDRSRVGVILGNIALPTEKASALARDYLGRTFAERAWGRAGEASGVHWLNRHVAGLPAGILAKALRLGGGCFTLDAACASSLYAVHLAAQELYAGRADAMLAGGVSRPDCLYTQMGFSQLRALSPSGRASPFDARADGLVVGEGAGIFLLKRLADAVQAGDTILAVLVAGGLSNDIGGSLLAPASEGQLRALRAAYRPAEWSPHEVELIECHATGTPVGDAVEFQSLMALWGQGGWRRGQCVIGSIKSTVGHLLTGAGAAGLVKVVSALRSRVLPPTANFSQPAPGIDLDGSPFRILTQPTDWHSDRPRRAAISGFGFGGINAHLLLEEWPGAGARVSVAVPAPAPSSPAAIAVVGLAAYFGPWSALDKWQQRVLGGADERLPQRPGHWWGAADSDWFGAAGFDAAAFAGYYVDEVAVPGGRYRIPPRELQEMLPQQLLMLDTAAQALAAAPAASAGRERTGTYIGLGLDLNTTNFHFRWSIRDESLRDAAGPALNANRTMGALGSIAASRIAREFHLGGPSFTIASEESSGLRALEAAVRALQRGDIDHALVGAVDLAGDVRAVLATHQRHAFAPAGNARPFDAAAGGSCVGEGAAAVVLKRLDDAERDGDRIHAVIRGFGVASGGGIDEPAVTAAAYRAALTRAYADARASPESVDYLEAHGSGTPAEDRVELEAVAAFFGPRPTPLTLGSVKADIGHTGAAAPLAALVKACLCLEQQVLPPLRHIEQPLQALQHERFRLPRQPALWLRDRSAGPRRAGVSAISVDGNCVHVVLEEAPRSAPVWQRRPLGPLAEALFVVAGERPEELLRGLDALRDLAQASSTRSLEALALEWCARPDEGALAVAMVARDRTELLEQIAAARQAIAADPEQRLPAPGLMSSAVRDRVFYSPQPLGRAAQVAFVFPGSGNDFPGMGRDLALAWPEVLRRQDTENERLASQMLPHRFWDPAALEADVRERIFGQVTFGTLVTDLLQRFGVRPSAALGMSLGESAALFALRIWTERDRMWQAMQRSTLFVSDVTGRCDAVRRAWGLPEGETVDWAAGVVDVSAAEVRAALAGHSRVYLLIIAAPCECVIGGQRAEVTDVVRQLRCQFHELRHTSTVHCPVAQPVAAAYRELHRLPTTPSAGVRFYSSAFARTIELTDDAVADALLAQALHTVDFPATVEAAYRDGARVFIEIGPGASCTRNIAAILGDRPHLARAASSAGADGVSGMLRLLAQLCAERIPVDLTAVHGQEPPPAPATTPSERNIVVPCGGRPFVLPARPVVATPPPPAALGADASMAVPVAQAVAGHQAVAQAHAAYLRLATSLQQGFEQTLAFQTQLIETLLHAGPVAESAPQRVWLERRGCLEFARGSIARVFGPEYAVVDTYPTRVRLPDEPLMLVDRILSIEGEPRSLTSGRVITEHDVRVGAWYLDGGRIPTCIAVEAGQADLLLSGYLGIDLHTRGLAVYRLLDAAVTFHGGLPGPGAVIRYDIRIDSFFRQGETHLFRFHFEGTVNGEPLLSMRGGCAGFFSAEALAAGKGVVQTELDRRPARGVKPDDAGELPARTTASYDAGQVDALRRGDAAACFGALFAGVTLPEGLRLPGGRMRLVDRVTHLDPAGGRFGIGLIRAEADIDPEAWFLTCHFVDDRVMPGTLMYECCLHTLRIFLLRLGWVGDEPVVGEPVPGIASQLKCRGQVTAQTRTVTYEITLKERGYRPEPYALCDALMYADGKPIVEITNMSVRLTGLTRESIRAFWGQRQDQPRPLYEYRQILAFCIGKPSEAFGDRYRIFDEGRVIARLPGPPYLFLDRIVAVEGEPWKMVAGGKAAAQYDVPKDAWYFAADRQEAMPFCVLLEVALQACGWLAAYVGSALTSPIDLSFRNLGGTAELLETIRPDSGTLTATALLTRVATSGGMIVQSFDFAVRDQHRIVYRGETTFGFFSRQALAQQAGVREAVRYRPEAAETKRGETFPYPDGPPWPDAMLRMIERVELFVPDGGPHGLGFIRGGLTVDPAAWFFKAHFYQDPVIPGSLGLESLLQLMKVAAVRRWNCEPDVRFVVMRGGKHQWIYRGQVIPTNRQVTVEAIITACDDERQMLTADGLLMVDGLVAYQMRDFTIGVEPKWA